MLNLTGRKSRLLLGVDIGSSAVKLVELRRAGGRLRLQGYVIQPLPPGAVVERKIMAAGVVADCIRQALATLSPAIRHAAVAVPASSVMTCCLDMDAGLTDEDMEGQVLLEAEQHIPYPLTEVAIDFVREQKIGADAGHRPERVAVRLTACRRDSVESRVGALQAAGLVARVVDVESCAMARACSLLPLDAEDTVAVVDLGATLTTLHVLQSGHSLYTREQLFGRQPAEGIVRQVERALQLFHSSSGHVNPVKYLVLAGGVAVTPGLAELLGERLAVPLSIADPLPSLELAPGIDRQQLQNQAPALMTACGLAMRAC